MIMKNIFRVTSMAMCLFLSLMLQAKPRIERAEPLSWFTGMKMPLTLMLQGEDLADAFVRVGKLHFVSLLFFAIRREPEPPL